MFLPERRTEKGTRKIVRDKGRPIWVLPDAELKHRLRVLSFSEEVPITNSQIKANRALEGQLRCRGILATGKQSFIDGLQALGFSYQRKHDTNPEERVTRLIHEEYSREQVMAALQGRGTILTPKEFSERHQHEYHSIKNRIRYSPNIKTFPDRLRELHRDLFKEHIYPDLYAFVTARTWDINEGALKRTLLDRFSQGLPLGFSLSKDSEEERNLYNAILTLGARHARERERDHHKKAPLFARRGRVLAPSFISTVARLTGLHPAYLSGRDSGTSDYLGELGELFTKFLLYWTKIVDPTGRVYNNGFPLFFPTPLGEILPVSGGRVAFMSYDLNGNPIAGSRIHPDVRVGERSVEVKSGAAPFTPGRVKSLVSKYGGEPDKLFERGKYWIPHEIPVSLDELVELRQPSGLTVVFHTAPRVHKDAVQPLEQEGFTVLTPHHFGDYLRKLIRLLDKKGETDFIQSSIPGGHNLEHLLTLYDDLVDRPHLLQRQSDRLRLQWSCNLLRHLVALGERRAYPDRENIVPAPPTPQQTPVAISRALGGRVTSNRYGSYLQVTEPLEALACSSVREHLAHHVQSLVRKGVDPQRYHSFVKGDLPSEKHIPLEKVLFFDIESVTLPGREFNRGESVPFVIGTMRYDNGFVLRSYVSRNPGEERAALAAFARSLEGTSLLVTFNGASYDLTVFEQRMLSHSLTARLPAHLDLLPVVRATWKKRLPNHRLQTLERIAYGHKREGDIPGSQISEAYRAFLATADPTHLKRILDHNNLDLAVMGAIFCDSYKP